MTRIGVITFHKSYNYGSVLQTYALQIKLKEIMPKAEISVVDYFPENLDEVQRFFVKTKNLRNLVHNIIVAKNYPKYYKRTKAFKFFVSSHIALSENQYRSLSELEHLNQKYDIVIAGSDQIWNKNAIDFSLGYFCYNMHGIKKIAYAPSIGNGIFKLPEDKAIYDALLDFDFISVREKSGAEKLKNFIDKNVSVVLDPTLLLSKVDYLKIATNKNIDYDYIFAYSVKMSDDFLKKVKYISKKINLPIITIVSGSNGFKAKKYGIKIYSNSSPEDFIALVRDAKLIVTDSFHGTAFSINFNKEFYCICNNNIDMRDARLTTLLYELGLKERILAYECNSNEDYSLSINYKEVNSKMNSLKRNSISFLENALQRE